MQKYKTSTFSTLWGLIALGALAFSQTACPAANNSNNNNNNAEKPVLRIGAVFSDKGAANNPNVDGVKLAAKDLNEAGVLSHQIQIVPRFFTPDTDILALAQSSVDDEKVIAFAAEFSAVAAPILRMTNTDAYANVIQCNGASTSAPLNDPTIPNADDGKITSDKNDTLFRTIGNNLTENRLIWKLQEDPDRVGILYVDDAFGNSQHDAFVNNAASDGKTLVVEAPFASALQLADLQPTIDNIIEKNRTGELTSLVIVGLPATHGGALVKALVEAPTPFAGTLFLSASTLDDTVFAVQTGAFTQWLARPGNKLKGTRFDLVSGDNTIPWLNRFVETTGISSYDNFVTFHADCMYSYAIALIEADVKGEDPATFLKQGMINQKQASLSGDVVEVSPNIEGLKAARQAFLDGKKVRLNGASGRMEYNDVGDRAVQLYAVMKVEGTGPYDWAVEELWDPISNECLDGCD